MSRKPSALIIDDDPLLLQGLDFALRKLGIEPVHTRNPERFARLAMSGDYELFFVDLSLRSGTGMSIVERVRAQKGPEPRILVLSADHNSDTIREALARGANDYLVKPLEREHLAAKLRRHLIKSGAQDGGFAPFGESAQGRTEAKLTLRAEVVEIDDRGVRLRTPHYLVKDSVISLGGDLFHEIIGAVANGEPKARVPRGCLVKVLSSWSEPGDGATYGAYAEFDRVGEDVRWHRALRRWLATR